MKKINQFSFSRLVNVFIILTLFTLKASAAIFWVGDSPNCTGSDVRSSLPAALLSAAFTNTEDEIRLTSTLDYIGSGNNFTLTDFSTNSVGAITISGGYADCYTNYEPSLRVNIGHTTNTIFTVRTSSQTTSEVTFKNLVISRSDQHGIDVQSGGFVYLENTTVEKHTNGGIVVSGGYLSVDADSELYDNRIVDSGGNFVSGSKGGGIKCTGFGSTVFFNGVSHFNWAEQGGHFYVGNSCLFQMTDGSVIKGFQSPLNAPDVFCAMNGCGAFVESGGEFYAQGEGQRILFEDLGTLENGSALFIRGTGFASLKNVYIENSGDGNTSEAKNSEGTMIYVENGGSWPSLVINRAEACPFPISCSRFENNNYTNSLIYADNAVIEVSRTVINGNQSIFSRNDTGSGWTGSLFRVDNGGVLKLARLGITNNEANSVMDAKGIDSVIESSYVTATANQYENDTGLYDSFGITQNTTGSGLVTVENSIIYQTQGLDLDSGTFNGKCNLVEDDTEWGNLGIMTEGTPQFSNVASGDIRQLAASDGVDMCESSLFTLAEDKDLEYQNSPVNESSNPQGSPGEGGLYDAGADEVYDNIGDDMFLLSVLKDGTGAVTSAPLGIACGVDCTEVYFNGTLVTLYAVGQSGFVFDRWSANCPLPNDDECLISMTESSTITAYFVPVDLIFKDGFE